MHHLCNIAVLCTNTGCLNRDNRSTYFIGIQSRVNCHLHSHLLVINFTQFIQNYIEASHQHPQSHKIYFTRVLMRTELFIHT